MTSVKKRKLDIEEVANEGLSDVNQALKDSQTDLSQVAMQLSTIFKVVQRLEIN